MFRITHSIPDSHGISIKTPDGRIVTTGDYKFDLTPIGPMANLYKMACLGHEGVDLLISDSTNALNEGFSNSESVVDETLGEMFEKYKTNRIIIATFASNIYRVKHIFETCYKHNRKICIFGRSMENNINISLNAGYIDHKELLVSPEEANNLKPGEVTILCTGSQGEPLAALSRISNGTHKQIKLRPDDIVIFSSSAIPGNALSISKTINKLYLQGVKVYTNNTLTDLHTSGHANEEEIKLMIRLIKPKYLMPFHGDYRMLKRQADIGINCGIPKENTFILKNGDSLVLKNHVITKGESMPGADVYVDGNRIGEVGSAVLKDRKIMANDGILVVIANIDMHKKELLIKPNITTRGFILVNENEELIEDFFFINETNKLKVLENIISLCTGRLEKYGNYTFAQNIQVISPTKKGELGTKELNKSLQQAINPESEEKNERKYIDSVFREGDRIMQIKNNYDIYWEKREPTLEMGKGVFNGEYGTILNIDEVEKKVKIKFDDDKLVWYNFDELEQIEHSYCITVHKAQRK